MYSLDAQNFYDVAIQSLSFDFDILFLVRRVKVTCPSQFSGDVHFLLTCCITHNNYIYSPDQAKRRGREWINIWDEKEHIKRWSSDMLFESADKYIDSESLKDHIYGLCEFDDYSIDISNGMLSVGFLSFDSFFLDNFSAGTWPDFDFNGIDDPISVNFSCVGLSS